MYSYQLVCQYLFRLTLEHIDCDGSLGFQSKELIVNAHLSLGDVDQYPIIDVTIDGADE